MADMTPQEAAQFVRDGNVPDYFDRRFREALTVLADLADPPKPKAEWMVGGSFKNAAIRDGATVALCWDNIGSVNDNISLAAHRAVVAMHALRADEEGIDVVALIEEARR